MNRNPQMKDDMTDDSAQSDQEAMGGLPPPVAVLARNAAARAADATAQEQFRLLNHEQRQHAQVNSQRVLLLQFRHP